MVQCEIRSTFRNQVSHTSFTAAAEKEYHDDEIFFGGWDLNCDVFSMYDNRRWFLIQCLFRSQDDRKLFMRRRTLKLPVVELATWWHVKSNSTWHRPPGAISTHLQKWSVLWCRSLTSDRTILSAFVAVGSSKSDQRFPRLNSVPFRLGLLCFTSLFWHESWGKEYSWTMGIPSTLHARWGLGNFDVTCFILFPDELFGLRCKNCFSDMQNLAVITEWPSMPDSQTCFLITCDIWFVLASFTALYFPFLARNVELKSCLWSSVCYSNFSTRWGSGNLQQYLLHYLPDEFSGLWCKS